MVQKTLLDIVRSNRDNPDAIIAAGELVDMRFKSGSSMSLRAAKLFCLLVQEAGVHIAEDKQHRVPYSVVNESFHKSRSDLIKAIDELHSTIIKVQVKPHDRPSFIKSGPILDDVERENDGLLDAEIRFEFSKALRRVISDSNHWANLSRRAVLAFESKFSLRLYMFLSLRAGLRKTGEDFTMEDIREIFGLAPGKFTRWQDLRRFVIEKAISEVNHLAGFTADYIPIKRGRKVSGIRLVWGRKDGDELIESFKELERHRAGRRARRESNVEVIAQENAALRHSIASSLAAAPYADATVVQPANDRDEEPQ